MKNLDGYIGHPLNSSTSKETHSFSKASRFAHKDKPYVPFDSENAIYFTNCPPRRHKEPPVSDMAKRVLFLTKK